MALFLETTHSSSSNYEGENFQEMLFSQMVGMQEEMQLVEAIYQADFIMHEQNKNLSESARVLKEGNFVANVFTKLKEWIIKAWDWIKNFVIKIKDKIVEIFNRIKDHITGNTVTISKAWVAKTEATINRADSAKSFIKKVVKLKDKNSLEALKKTWESQAAALQKKIDESTKIKGDTTISVTYFDKIVALQNDIVKEVNEAYNDVKSDINDLEKEMGENVTKVKAGSNDEEAAKMVKSNGEVIGLMREITAMVRTAVIGVSQAVANNAGATSGAMGPNDGPQKPEENPAKPEAPTTSAPTRSASVTKKINDFRDKISAEKKKAQMLIKNSPSRRASIEVESEKRIKSLQAELDKLQSL